MNKLTFQFEDLLIKACHYELVEVIIKIKEQHDLDVLKTRDSDGNTCLIIAAIKSNIKIAKIFLVHPEIIDAKNNQGLDAISISVYNNDNLMFFLLASNLNTKLQNVSYLCKMAIRMENFDILDYLTKRLADVKIFFSFFFKNRKIFFK